MARIRFAGRPSRRNRSPKFSSVYERSESEKHALDVLDPQTRLLVNIQRGLKHFSELAGPCDEVSWLSFGGFLSLTGHCWAAMRLWIHFQYSFFKDTTLCIT